MQITTVGIDLAKNVFQIHAVDAQGKTALRKQLRRDQMSTFFVNLPRRPLRRRAGIASIYKSNCIFNIDSFYHVHQEQD